MSLLPTATLGLWVSPKQTQEQIEADAFAMDVIAKVSGYFCFLGGHPEWTYEPGDEQAPFDVRMLALKVIRRTYVNPDQVVQEGNVGPLGGDRVADDAALSFELTKTERRVLTKYNDEGDPEEGGALWIQPIGQDEASSLIDATLYVGDDSQINLESSADPREWKVPLFSPGDPGDPNFYTD